MNRFANLTLAAALLLGASAPAMAVDAPDIILPNYNGAHVIQGLSNNGLYGVAAIKNDDGGFTYNVGGVFYDLTGKTPKATDLTSGRSACSANDVTDDGKLVVGSVDRQPALCRLVDGKWTWEKLPVPNKTITLRQEDMMSGQVTYVDFTLDGGRINAVTPDGKYAVGTSTCNANEMLEYATMWDLTTKQIIETGAPITNRLGQDDHNSRFMQLSDDGRYILGWNSFVYPEDDYIFVYDREKKKDIGLYYINPGKFYDVRIAGYDEMELDGISKSLTSDGHYVTGRIAKGSGNYTFLFDVWNEELKVLDDGVHTDTWGWSVTKDADLVFSGTPAVFPYADALVYYNNYMFPFADLYRDVYKLNIERYGITNTGKPTLVSEDGRTLVFVTEKNESYVARFHEPISDALDRINLMAGWSVYPVQGTVMTKVSETVVTFNNPIDSDGSKYGEIGLFDSKGTKVASPRANGVSLNNNRLTVQFDPYTMNAGEKYSVVIPQGVCYVKGQPNSTNEEITVTYTGRADVPVAMKSVSPANHSTLASLDINDNPVVVSFDAAVKINGTANNRPIAHLYIDDADVPAAALNLDVDLTTNTLVVYPTATVFLYKGAEYRIDVPAGAVVDLSGAGPSEAFSISYHGSYVPTMGDALYLFKSDCNSYDNFLFYEGDHGTPTSEYAAMNFTADETPWAVVMDDETSTDMAFGSHSVYVDGRQSDDWVTTRQIRLPDDVDTYLSFQSQSYRKNKEDYLKVYIYENEKALNQLLPSDIADIRANGKLVYNEKQDPGKTEGTMAGEWTDNVIDLSDYKGKSIYICFLNDNKNQSMVMIDNIFVVKNVDSFITVTSNTNVVNLPSAPVKGIITVQSELANYKDLSMTLLDGEGKTVSELKATGLSLKAGDTYNFEFPQELPLTLGEENAYTIRYTLDDDANTYQGVIRDLAFEPEKRVVIEEYTGRDCQFCPLGINVIERLESLYGNKIVPVILHVYNGSDPKGANMISYAASIFGTNAAAPSAIINRRPSPSMPMYTDNETNRYHITSADVPGTAKTWLDEVVDDLNEPTFLGIDIQPVPAISGVTYDVKVKSALNLSDQNIRVLGVLLEDGLLDSQENGLFSLSDPMLGEFGKGGAYGEPTFWFIFNNVARGYWGQSSKGTPRLLPNDLKVGQEYTVRIDYAIPQIVENINNIKMAVILIDETTGRVINAGVSAPDLTGVDEIIDGMAGLSVAKSGSVITVAGSGDVQVAVYSLDGRVLRTVNGNGTFSFGLDGYNGMVIVKAVSGGNTVTEKFMM